jgi:prepilin-type N-terminal cleavage/methylation domain-containing protein/prepilin-type processing-associated H-X9-DG protein
MLIVPRPSHSALTLIECLVAITIIGMLVGIAFTASSPKLAVARRVPCLSHLKAWGVATHAFTSEQDDLLPMDGAPNGISTRNAWYADLPPLIGLPPYHLEGPWRTNPSVALPRRPWICPSNPRNSNGRMLFHYALNRRATGSGRENRQRSLSSVQDPSSLVWLFDNGGLAAVASEGNAHPSVHGAGAQFLFLDGHVQRLPNTAYWDLKHDKPLRNPVGLRWKRE